MRLFTFLPGALLLLAQPVVSRLSPYSPDDNLRPDNVTGLDYKYYDQIGSYYNGTLTIYLEPKYNPTPQPHTGRICREEWENKTLEIPMKAIAGFQEVAPKAPSVNPFFLNIDAWDKHYNLSNNYQTANYSDFEENRITTNTDYDGNSTWYFNITDNDTALWYNFGGHMTTFFLGYQQFKYNVSGLCDGGPEQALLFSGAFLSPDSRVKYDWTDNPIPVPTIRGSFNENQASVEMSGLFRAASSTTEMVGKIRMSFDGLVDKERSDQLFMRNKKPEWNATLGFEVGAVGGAEESAGNPVSPGWLGRSMLSAALVVVIMVW